jgi:hypothetical protein
MTYQQVVNRLLTIMNNHYLINQTGYGNLSDIHTPDDEESPDYPYAFLNPISVSVGAFSFSSQFNLILMDQVTDGDTTAAEDIKVQSNCLMYLQDIMSHFRQTDEDRNLDIVVDVNATPFKERFEDNVAGVTAQITIQSITPLDGCEAAMP